MVTEKELKEMWSRSPGKQYNVSISKILEALQETDGKISISWSGGKDSSFMLYLVSSVWSSLEIKKPITVTFADTTNEYKSIYTYIEEFLPYLTSKFGVEFDFVVTRPDNNKTYVSVVKEIGLPLVSKKVSLAVKRIRKYLKDRDMVYSDVEPYLDQTIENVEIMKSMGLNKDAILILLGYSHKHDNFKSSFKLAKRWRPLIIAPFKISDECCSELKKKPMSKANKKLGNFQPMIGEMACDSKTRKDAYLKTGCNNFVNGVGKSKPLGGMTEQTLLEHIYNLNIPMAACYGKLEYKKESYKFSLAQRTGCCLCGFGIMHELDRFVKLLKIEPQKVKFAFKPVSEGGLGYKEACEYLNKYCKTNIQIPNIQKED